MKLNGKIDVSNIFLYIKISDGNSATPKADVQKQLQSLLKNIPAETIKNGKSNIYT